MKQIHQETDLALVSSYFLQWALENIEKGQTQEGANVLAYLLAQDQAPNAIKAQAEEAWEELATWICPSVLHDAKYFGRKFILEELMSMILPEYTQA